MALDKVMVTFCKMLGGRMGRKAEVTPLVIVNNAYETHHNTLMGCLDDIKS